MKKIVRAVWKQATSKRLRGYFFCFCFNNLILIHFLKYKTIETHARAFLRLNISAVSSVKRSRFKNANASMIRNDMNYIHFLISNSENFIAS